MRRFFLLFAFIYSGFMVQGQSGSFDFIDDFNSGGAERWQPVGEWRVMEGAYVGDATIVNSGTNSFIQDFTAGDLYMEVDMESNVRVDKYILLRYTDPSNVIALNFRANPYGDLVVHQTRDNQFELLTPEFSVMIPHEMDQRIHVAVELVGQHLTVWVDNVKVLDREFPLLITNTGQVGLSVIPDGLARFDNIKVNRFDNPPPTITCPANITVTADAGLCTYTFSETSPPSSPKISDDTDFYFVLSGATTGKSSGSIGNATFNTGVTTVTYTAGDADGREVSCSFTVTVQDKEAPAITGVSATPAVLWPPNHKMVDVTVNYSIGTTCGGSTATLSVTGNDGATSSDWEILDAHHVRLRAERSGGGNGRTYIITITLTDAAGNKTTKTVNVVVPHDMSGKEKGKKDKGDLKVRVLPNPSQYDFTLQVQSSSDKKISVRVSNALGKIIEVKQNMSMKGILRLGGNYAPGTYYAEVLQSSSRSVVKLVKLPR